MKKEIQNILNSRDFHDEIDDIYNIRGVAAIKIQLLDRNNICRIILTYAGISPTLHSTIIFQSLPIEKINTDRNIYEITKFILKYFSEKSHYQKSRSEDIRKYKGLNEESGKWDSQNYISFHYLKHLMIDKAAAEIAKENNSGLKDKIANVINSIHNKTSPKAEGHVFQFPNRAIGETENGHRYVAGRTRIKHQGKTVARITGGHISLQGVQLPETVVTNCIGRRVGEIASVHREVDERVIKAAYNDQKNLILEVEQEFVPLRNYI